MQQFDSTLQTPNTEIETDQCCQECLSRHCLQFLVTVKTRQLIESLFQSNANTKGTSKFSVFAHSFTFSLSKSLSMIISFY